MTSIVRVSGFPYLLVILHVLYRQKLTQNQLRPRTRESRSVEFCYYLQLCDF